MKTPEELNRLRDEKAEQHGWDKVPDSMGAVARTSYRRSFQLGWNAAVEAVQGEQQESPAPDAYHNTLVDELAAAEARVKELEAALLNSDRIAKAIEGKGGGEPTHQAEGGE